LVLPVIIEECEIPSFLKDRLYIKFIEPNKFTESFNGLLEKLFSSDTQEICEYCKNHLPLVLDRCPHCARSAPAPNVRAARVPLERETLDIRYEDAINDATARGCEKIIRKFESSLTESKAIIVLSKNQLMHLVSESKLYSYYRLINSGEGMKGDALRAMTDSVLFSGYEQHIRFATLSLDGIGLSNYGECSLVLRDDLIAHRTSFFEENSAQFMKHHKIRMTDVNPLPSGYRATWKDRGKLCIAKLAGRISTDTTSDDFPHLLLQNGATADEDDFIEAHIWGSLTILAVERVIFSSRSAKGRSETTLLRALNKKLNSIGIEVVISNL
jgi:hypothetical protein